MERLTLYDGSNRPELQCCMDCGPGCGDDNQNCGYCEKPDAAYARLAAYEDINMTPEEVRQLRDNYNDLCDGLSPPYKTRELIHELQKYRKIGLTPERIVELNTFVGSEIERLLEKLGQMEEFGGRLIIRLGRINNLAVGFVESGPYEDANAEALKVMQQIDRLSVMPEPPKEAHDGLDD